jgi:hypothetical protein
MGFAHVCVSDAGMELPLRPRNIVCIAGTTTSRMIGPMSMPPTPTVASGRQIDEGQREER